MSITVLAQSNAVASHTGDTAEAVLATYTLPANTLSANGKLEIITEWSGTGTGGGTRRIRFGGLSGTVYGSQGSNTANAQGLIYIAANNSTGAQKSAQANITAPFGNGTAVTSSVDTTADVDIVFTGQLNNAGDTVRLESYTILQIEP